MADIMDQ